MTRRAWWLIVLNIFVPGSAQVLAGSRALGRFGLRATLCFLALVVVTGAAYAMNPEILLTVTTNSIGLWIIAAVMVFYAVVWVVLTFDTIRLVRLVKARPQARPFIAGLATVVLAAVVGVAGYGASVATTASDFLSSVFAAGLSEPPVDGRYNILLLGGDAGADRMGMRPDSMSVVSIDAETGRADIIGLPRDLEDVPFGRLAIECGLPGRLRLRESLRRGCLHAQLDLYRGRPEEPGDVPERVGRQQRSRH